MAHAREKEGRFNKKERERRVEGARRRRNRVAMDMERVTKQDGEC